MPIVSRRGRLWPVLLLSITAAACTSDPTPPASGDLAGTSLVFAIAEEPSSLNPLAGYAEHGAAKIFDGLLEHRSNGSLRPALATELPEPSTDGRTWTVKLRDNVVFSDGSQFTADDVVATYRALLNPAVNSPVRQRFPMLSGVASVDSMTVRFDLSRPYAPFPQLLVLGILPSESLSRPAPAAAGAPPIGTGPYKLAEWQRGQRMVLEANKIYYDGTPAITKVTVEFIGDDDARAARMREGKLDGAQLPPNLARTFEGTDGMLVVAHSAADVHGVHMPPGNPVTADPMLRMALNYAVDRKSIVDTVLAGKATEASTPMPDVLAEFIEPTARFAQDVTKALDLLAEGGWLPGTDGMRAKNGVTAAFTLAYRGGDAVSRDLAGAFATAAKGIGVQVTLEATDGANLTGRAAKDAVLLGSGNPFDPDLRLYDLLHSPAGNNPTIDAALEAGRVATDPAQRAVAYRKLQRTYIGAPTMVVLAEPQHLYVIRASWNGYQPVIDGENAGLSWGAWWNLHKWTPR